MNSISVLLILGFACAIVFVSIVKLDRWLDERETNAMLEADRRRQEAREALARVYRENAGHIRLGHKDGGNR